MKKNYRSVSIIMTGMVLAGALTGCGGKNYPATYETVPTESCEHAADTGSYPVYSEPASSSDICADAALGSADVSGECEAQYSYNAANKSAMATEESCSSEYSDECFYEYEYNTESYDKPEENKFMLVQSQPLSTFAADVDTASYANVRRMIESGYSAYDIVSDAVRPEEFINYFSYDLSGPDKGEKFGVTTEVSSCPWNEDHELLFVGVKAEDELDGEIPKSNLVFLIDVSGSMSTGNKLPLLQKAFTNMVDNLPDEGTVSIVTYSSREDVVLNGVPMSDKKTIKNAIKALYANGSTAGERGMEMAYEIAKDNFIEGGNNRIIMATDGDLNVGISSVDELEDFVEEKKNEGIFLSVLGFGDGNYKDDKLETIADCGNGNYSYIDSALEAKKVLVDEMSSTLVTVAKDVKFQVEFNPANVNAYRLIGYENRQMDAVDFNDDTKDGGEVGSGHSVVALYEIIPADSTAAVSLKYQDSEVKENSNEYATVKIRYKEPEANESKLVSYIVDAEDYQEKVSDNMAFAQLVSEFAMLLSDSEYASTLSYDGILEGYKEIENTDEYKDEFYNLVRMVEKRS